MSINNNKQLEKNKRFGNAPNNLILNNDKLIKISRFGGIELSARV